MLEEIQTFDSFEAETKFVVEPFRSAFGARWLHEARSSKPQRNWLLKNLLLASTFGVVYGPPGCGKSFLVSDMCLTMASGVLPGAERPDWFGYKGRPFGIVYVVAEGSDDFEIRLHAWMADKGIPEDAVLPFVYLPTNVDLRSSDADAKKLVDEIKGLSAEMRHRCGVPVEMVVIDTVARALAGGNENASEVMSSFVTNCGAIQKACGVTVLGVHHGGKEAGRGPRGHEGLHGAADFEIEVVGATEDTPNVWTVRKLKSGPGGATHRFRLRQTTVGTDDDGDPITSCIVTNNAATQEASKEKEKPNGFKVSQTEREFLSVLADVIDQKGVMPPADLRVPTSVVLVANAEDVRKAFKAKYEATEEGDEKQINARLRARWSRATKSLLRFNVIGSQKPWLYFTGKEIQKFRVRGIQSPEAPPSYVTSMNDYGDEMLPPDSAAEADLSAL